MIAIEKKVEQILKCKYSLDSFIELSNELFYGMQLIAPGKYNKEFSKFSTHIKGCIHIGNYETPDNKKIVILAVELVKEDYVKGSRSTQRSYAKKIIENSNSDAAFIAFYTDGEPTWRISFVKLDLEMKINDGNLSTIENITPAKRYSYLVGDGEPCHTAISRIGIFLRNEKSTPTIEDLEDAFSVEKVTNEFFGLYCEKFHQIREHLESNEDFMEEAKLHNYSASQFAKKLMGQIVFLYFLQKKGWLGVRALPRIMNKKEFKNAVYSHGKRSKELVPKLYISYDDNEYRLSAKGLNNLTDEEEEFVASCVKGEPWGTGPHTFMRKLFNFSIKRNANFFDDYLEPLFYDALNRNRGEQGYCPSLHCRIPFLSGGLFEPIDGYDWKNNDFSIPNDVFSNLDSMMNIARAGY